MTSGPGLANKRRRRAEPLDLGLIEQVALLSLEGSRASAKFATGIAARAYPEGLYGYRAAIDSLLARGLVERTGVTRHVVACPSSTRGQYVRLVEAVIASTAAPVGPASELFVLLAVAGTLPVTSGPAHLRARLRIIDMDQKQPLARAVVVLMDNVGVTTTRELADKLLPPHLFPLADRASSHPINYGYAFFGSWS